MGSRGPIEQPTALKLLRGNPGNRPINELEPKSPLVKSASPPEWLGDVARVYWFRMVGVLSEMRVLTAADMGLLERYCDFLADWRHCQAQLAKKPDICYPIYETADVLQSDGTVKKQRVVKYLVEWPHVSKKLKLSEHLLRIEMHFGLTPAARTRILAEPGEDPVGDMFEPEN